MATSSQLHSHRDYTIGWICALRKEQTAATAMLDAIHEDLPNPSTDPNAYTLGSIGKHNVVIACLPEGKYGTNAAATAATWMASTFPSVRFGLMVGIGGGIPCNKIRLGDVVISKPGNGFPGVIQWDLGKVEHDGIIEHTGSLNNPPIALLTSLAKLGTKREMEGSQIPNYLANMGEKWPTLAAKYTRLESLRDTLFADDYPHIESTSTNSSSQDAQAYDTETEEEDEDEEEGATDCRFCDISKARKRKPRTTRIHYGLIASGNMVVKDAQFRNRLNERFSNKILCVEMEAAGLMSSFPCLVIRGICDYADSHKNKAWQEYAAAVAAASAKELLLVVPVHAVEQMDTITSILSNISGDVKLAVGYLEEARVHRHNQEDERIIEWLSPLDYGAEHSDVLKRWQPGTGQWLLNSTEFNEFIETDKHIIFCPGIPGAGKTVMTAAVIDYLHKRFGNDSSIGIAYIYFNFKRYNEQTPNSVFLSLLKQVAKQQPCLPDSVKSLHERHAKRNTRPSFEEILETFQEVVNLYTKAFVIIDALDECSTVGHCRETILSEIIACAKRSDLKLFTTSRDIPEISDRFKSTLRLEIGATELDIRRYIDGRLSKLPPISVISQSKSLQEEIKTVINNTVNRMFLLAQLHFDRLIDCITRKAVMKALKDLPTGSGAYDYAYDAAMERINQQSSSRSALAINALSWITHARWPLSVVELQQALAVEIGEDEFDEDNLPQIEDIMSTTIGLVAIDEKSKIIRLVHHTTQEFFDRTRQKWLPKAETYIAEVCSSYLSSSAIERQCRYYIQISEILKSFKFWYYAVYNWKYHVRTSTFSQTHVNFLRKTSNFEAFLRGFHILRRTPPGIYKFNTHHVKEYLNVDIIPKNVTSLHVAAELGISEIVNVLLKEFSNPDERDSYNRSPLHMAASGGYSTTMEALINFGQVDVDAISKISRYTPLIRAAQGGHTAAVKLLLDTGKVNVGFKCKRGKTALWYAAVGGHVDIVKLLLDARLYDPDVIQEIHSSALLGAVIMEREIVVNLILETGHADMNVQTASICGPFYWGHLVDHDCSWADFTWYYPFSKLLWGDKSIGEVSLNEGKSAFILLLCLGNETLLELFLGNEEVDVDLAIEDQYVNSALFTAAYCGRVSLFQLLLDSGRCHLNSRNPDGRTLLMIAASQGHESLVKLLLSKDISAVDWCDKCGNTALSLVIDSVEEHTSVAKLLINTGKANINTRDEDGLTLLCDAAEYGHENIFQLLFEMLEVEINSDKTDGKLLLIAAASGKRSTVKLCLDSRKFDINARDHFGLSPLLLAAQSLYDDSDILQLLLDMDTVEIGARDYEHKRTALLWAADAGSVKKFTTLLQTGKFDINERDVNGMTPFILAVQQYRSDIVEFLLNAEGVDLYTRDHKHKRTALMWATYAGQAKVFLTLLRAGKFDINEADAHGLTPFLIAAKEGKADIVRILLDTDGVDLYRRDSKYGRTAMMWAASVMNPAPFFLLLHSGKFDLKEKGLDGLDSTEIAIKRKNSVHVSLLKMDQDQINNWYTITCNNIMRPVTD